ncbi:unnamed protein product [Alternaria alternata]
MSQLRPDFQSVRAFCNNQDYQFILAEALNNRRLDRSTAKALRVEFGLKNLENSRCKWLLRSIYLSVWHYVCTLQAQGKKPATIAQDLRTCTGLPYTGRMITRYTDEPFFKGLHEGTISTVPITPSHALDRATSAADPAMSSANEDEEEDHESLMEWDAEMNLQQQLWALRNFNPGHGADGSMTLGNEGSLALPNGDAMRVDANLPGFGMDLESAESYQPGLFTLDPHSIPGPEPYFPSHQFPEFMQPQSSMYPGVYYQYIPHQQVFNHQDVGEQYDFQDTHEETQDDLFGIDPQLLNL